MAVDALLARGNEALAAGRWDDARAAFTAALDHDEDPAALLGLADALWWLADAGAAAAHMERAYALLRPAGAVAEAATTAVWLAVMYKKSLGNQVACSGWVAAAERLLGADDGGPAHGWLWWAQALDTTDAQRRLALVRQALDRARTIDDADLELCALSELGAALVAAGEVAEGLRLVDEAMAGALGGQICQPETVVASTCSMLVACDLAADLDRVTQWCRVADRFMVTYGCPFLFADCRMRYGSVLLATGHWDDADGALRAALQAAPAETDYHLQALVRLAELRLRQGRLEEAASLLTGDGERPAAGAVAAALHHARGEHDLAATLLTRHLQRGHLRGPDAAVVLGLLVEVHLAAGDIEAAAVAAKRLADLQRTHASARIEGRAALATGRMAQAGGEHHEAAASFEQAVDAFARASLPYDSARARLALAAALAGEQPQLALAEAQAAGATFQRLGAAPDADAAAALARDLGGPARTGPKGMGVLTRREHEVLRLLGEGLSNPEIAARLVISPKTASHHVSNVLAKLGLRNRAEAAAHAARTVAERG